VFCSKIYKEKDSIMVVKIGEKKRMKNSTIVVGMFVVIGLFVLMQSSSALIVVRAPLNYSNHSTANTVYFNVSYTNQSADIVDPRNFTVYTNFSGSWLVIARGANTTATECLSYSGAGSPSCNVSLNLTSVNASGYHTINISFDNGTTKRGAAVVTTPIRIDTRIPQEVNMTNTINGAAITFNAGSNISGTVNINISARDNLGNWSAPSDNSSAIAVVLNITNGLGVQNQSITATRQANTQYFSVSVNTNALADGNKTFTVHVTDESGNVNKTRKLGNIITDNTAPTITAATNAASTTKTKLVVDLSLSDTVGVNSTCGSDSNNAVITGTGISQVLTEENLKCGTSYVYTVTCYDEVRNRRQLSTTHTTSACTTGGGSYASGGGGGGSSGATVWKNTYVEDKVDIAIVPGGVSQSLGSKERIKIKVGVATHHVGVESVSTDSAVIAVESEEQRVTLKVGESAKFDVDGDNRYELKVTLTGISAGKASVVALAIDEPVTQEEEDSKVVPASKDSPGEPSTPPAEPSDSSSGGGMMWLLVVLVVVVVAVVVWVMMKHKGGRAKAKKK
jgi:hypothetical protein